MHKSAAKAFMECKFISSKFKFLYNHFNEPKYIF